MKKDMDGCTHHRPAGAVMTAPTSTVNASFDLLSRRVRPDSEAAPWVVESICELEVRVAALVSENERLRADLTDADEAYESCLPYAKRYDWLRNNRTVVWYGADHIESSPMWADILDAAIDAAIDLPEQL